MASTNWLKVKDDLHEEPEVLEMARELKTRPEHVVGYCIRFWGWVSRNCHDGSVTNVTLESVESVLNMPHFLSMMCKVGWLEYIESTSGTQLIIPKFDRHLSQGAKSRALAARRKRHARVPKMSRSKRDNSVTREEKRREDKVTPISPSKHFDEFWKVVPKKADKRNARKSYDRAVKLLKVEQPDLPDVHAFLRARMKAYAASDVGRSEFCKYPATWLNAGSYDDDDFAWSRSDQGKSEPEQEYERI